ncbi:hypothetical protein L7F22_033429 [Adiantum nelumboides]|nr:hypothetical protein [Adiantum nelumboides]
MADNNEEGRINVDSFDFANEGASEETPMLVNYLITRLQQAMPNPTLQGEVQQQLQAYGFLPPHQEERVPEKSLGETSKRGISKIEIQRAQMAKGVRGQRSSSSSTWTLVLMVMLAMSLSLLLFMALRPSSSSSSLDLAHGALVSLRLPAISVSQHITRLNVEKESFGKPWVEIVSWEPRAFLHHNFLVFNYSLTSYFEEKDISIYYYC